MQVVKEESTPEKREIGWYPIDKAMKLLNIEDHKEILKLADDKLKMKGYPNA